MNINECITFVVPIYTKSGKPETAIGLYKNPQNIECIDVSLSIVINQYQLKKQSKLIKGSQND